jgi:restriction system protein
MMPRYWVIAPYHADRPELWEKVWKYDLEHGIISIGWTRLGDVSSLTEEQLSELVDRTYSDKSPIARKGYCRVFWNFYHSIKPGDVVIARQGVKKIAGIGTVTRAAYYEQNKNSHPLGPGKAYSNHLDIRWGEESPKSIGDQFFARFTVNEIPEKTFLELTQTKTEVGSLAIVEEGVEDQAEFVLEKYLEEFIISNFDAIFKGKLRLYSDAEEGVVGRQFETDVGTIDILAQEIASNAFVVLELKKGRESDKVVGQILRYMGWVTENLCQQGQDVKGVIVCKEPDPRLSFSIKMVKNVSVKYYRVDFRLQDQPC